MKMDLFVRAVSEPKKIMNKSKKKDNNVIFHVYAGAKRLKMASLNLEHLLITWT
jgi:hypothetical protein